MTSATQTLPDDSDLLKAMLLAECARAERLEQIIKAMQRHRFGRRAENLPEDLMLLGLEEAEQGEAAEDAKHEQAGPAERQSRAARRHRNRGALPAHLPRKETIIDVDDPACPCCRMQVDGYSGNRALAGGDQVTLTFCWARAWRRLYELAAASATPIASEALTHTAELYRNESEIRGLSAANRCRIRQTKSRPVLEALKPWLRAKLGLISQKSKLAEAIRYALSRWDRLTRFADDGRTEIDSNVVERAIRPLAPTPKNAPIAGSDRSGEHGAIIASLVKTGALCGVDPQVYLADVLNRIVTGHLNARIEDLLS